MTKNTEFELKDFQSEVFKDFNKLKATMSVALLYSKGYKSLENDEDPLDLSFSPTSLFIRGFLAFFSFLGKSANKNILNKPDFIEKENRAAKIADNPKIKKILCPALRREISSDLFTEGKQVRMVKIVTASLTKKEIVEEFSIEKDVRLFSLIAMKIWRTGIVGYCR